MEAGPTDDPVLARFRTALEAVYGPRLARVVLFGSRARGEAQPDSDYDIGVFLHDWTGFDREALALAEIETDLLTATGAVVNALPLQVAAYEVQTAWMGALRRDGLVL